MDKKVYEFISQKTGDPIVEWRTCKWTGKKFPIFQWDRDLLKKLSITIGDKNYPALINDLSPEARQQYKLMFKNERRLYKTVCALTWKSIISRISPESWLQVYSNEAWASDHRDYCEYWLDIDKNKSVFDHISMLVQTTPYQDLLWSVSNVENNSVYTNHTADIFDCFYAFHCNTIEKSCYINRCFRSKFLFDCLGTNDSEVCYQCINCEKMYKCFFCNASTNCHNSYYLDNCHGCYDCIGCVNLVNKQYYVFNKALSKAEYLKKLSELQKDYYDATLVNIFSTLVENSPHNQLHTINTVWSVGNYISNSKNVFLSQLVNECDTIRYWLDMDQAQDCFDVCGFGHESFLLYNSTQVGRYSNHIYCCSTIGKGENLLYCIETKKSRNCFWCVNFKEKEYCIFNKQYTKEEYEKLVPELIESMKADWTWLSFLSPESSPYPYNDTVANDSFPIHTLIINGISQIINPQGHGSVTVLEPENIISHAILDLWGEEKIKIRWRTQDNEVHIPKGTETISTQDLPTIQDVQDDILDKAILCETSGNPFRIVPLELDFYRTYGLPLPHKHFDIRHDERLKKIAWIQLYLRNCDKCWVEMLSVYPSDYQGKVYCEECYNKEIYW